MPFFTCLVLKKSFQIKYTCGNVQRFVTVFSNKLVKCKSFWLWMDYKTYSMLFHSERLKQSNP